MLSGEGYEERIFVEGEGCGKKINTFLECKIKNYFVERGEAEMLKKMFLPAKPLVMVVMGIFMCGGRLVVGDLGPPSIQA